MVVTNILAPYRIPLFMALQRRLDHFSVLVMANREENRQWTIDNVSFHVETLPGFHYRPKGHDVSLHLNYDVYSALRRLKPDCVISGGFGPANMQALLYCLAQRKPYLCWGHLSFRDGSENSFVRKTLRRLIISRSAGGIAECGEAREVFLHYGLDRDRVILTLLPVDVKDWQARTDAFRGTSEAAQLRGRFGSPLLLSIGQIIPRKGYRELFDMYARVLQRRPEVSLVIAGEGPDRAKLEEEAKVRGWNRVHFLGFVSASELHKYFAIADLFVFHTLFDPFGAVLSEAMAARVPVVSSIHANATLDLVDDGVTGYRIDPKDGGAAAETILKVLNLSEDRRQTLVNAAFDRIAKWDIEPVADAMVSFLSRMCRKSERGA
jgi:glycosyltransferase involved in cell wall biosynthesis